MIRHSIKVLVVVALSAATFSSPASADDHEPPEAELMIRGKVVQKGVLTAFCWTTVPAPGQEIHRCVDSPSTIYPKEVRVRPGTRLKVRIHKAQPPEPVLLLTSRTAEGDERRMPLFLRPVVDDGETVAWDVVFDTCHTRRHYYLRLGGAWPDEEGGQSKQDAIWNFHVKTRRR